MDLANKEDGVWGEQFLGRSKGKSQIEWVEQCLGGEETEFEGRQSQMKFDFGEMGRKGNSWRRFRHEKVKQGKVLFWCLGIFKMGEI